MNNRGFRDTHGGLCQPTPATCLAVGMRARSEHGGGMLSMVLHAGIYAAQQTLFVCCMYMTAAAHVPS